MIRYSYIFLSEAQEDYENALDWYLEKSFPAADNFISDVNNIIALITAHPKRWRNEYGHFYELGLKKYPYTIVYSIDEENGLVIIVSIYHHSRNPGKKYKR